MLRNISAITISLLVLVGFARAEAPTSPAQIKAEMSTVYRSFKGLQKYLYARHPQLRAQAEKDEADKARAAQQGLPAWA